MLLGAGIKGFEEGLIYFSAALLLLLLLFDLKVAVEHIYDAQI